MGFRRAGKSTRYHSGTMRIARTFFLLLIYPYAANLAVVADASPQTPGISRQQTETSPWSSDHKDMQGTGINLLGGHREKMYPSRNTIALSEQGNQVFLTRLELLQRDSMSEHLSDALATWLKSNTPSWYDYVRPKSLNDPQVSDIELALSSSQTSLSRPELLKLETFVVSDEQQPEKRRISALLGMAWDAALIAPDAATAAKWAESFANLTALSEKQRAILFRPFLVMSRQSREPGLFARLAENPICNSLDEAQKKAVEFGKRYFETEKGAPEALASFGMDLLKEPPSAVTRDLLQEVIARLAEEGETETARKIQKALHSMLPSTDSEDQKASLELKTLQRIKRAEMYSPIHLALRDLTLKQFGEGRGPSTDIEECNQPARNTRLSRADARAEYLHQIKDRFFGDADFSRWAYFARLLPHDESTLVFRKSLLETAFGKATEDSAIADIVLSVRSVIDTDSETERQVAKKLLAPLRDMRNQPQTIAAIYCYDLEVGLRTGTIKPSTELPAELAKSPFKKYAWRHILSAAIGLGDPETVRQIIGEIPANLLLSEDFIALSVRAFTLLNMPDELKLARERAREEIRKLVTSGWATGNGSIVTDAIKLAMLLGEPSTIPDECIRDLLSSQKDELFLHNLTILDAIRHEDWPQAVSAADIAIGEFPAFPHLLYYKGIALAHVDQKDEAVKCLQTFLDIVHDEPDIADAKSLLKKIKGQDAK